MNSDIFFLTESKNEVAKIISPMELILIINIFFISIDFEIVYWQTMKLKYLSQIKLALELTLLLN